MSKNKKTKKVLVRNPAVPIKSSKSEEQNQNLKKVHFSDDALSKPDSARLASPEFCTLLQLADEIKAIKLKRGSSLSVPDMSKHRSLNFAPEERIYQDLVRLDVPGDEFVHETKSQPVIRIKKDPELDISKYTKINLDPEYYFSFNVIPSVKEPKHVFNAHCMHNKLSNWEESCN